jgi:tetratricopeptide (TPR) repeat protein
MYQSAIAQDSTNAEAYRGAGVVLLLQKNWPEAATYLEHAVQLDPTNLQGHVWLAQAYSNSGDVPKAKMEFNKALDIDPNNRDASKGLELIRKYEEQKALKKTGTAPSGTPPSGTKTSGTAPGGTKTSGTKSGGKPVGGTP